MIESHAVSLKEKKQTENTVFNNKEKLKPEEESNRKFGILPS